MHYFRSSILVTVAGLSLGAFLGWKTTGSLAGALSTTFLVAVLAVLEVSLSFDNAIVNAKVLKEMDLIWRRRFITWGIPIAVFGMRLVFPLIVVAIGAHHDLSRVSRFFATNEAPRPEGPPLHLQAHGYGTLVLVYQRAERFFPAEGVAAGAFGRSWTAKALPADTC